MSGNKTYLDINVYEAALERLNFVFDHFDRICLSFSGGKDSTVLLDMTQKEALKRGRIIDVLFLDWEAQYHATADHIARMTVDQPGINMYWVCLPITTSNETSIFEPLFTAWEPTKKDLWVRPMPEYGCVVSDYEFFPFYKYGMTFEDFVPAFDSWYAEQGGLCASLVAIRSDESLNRYRTIKKTKGRKRYEKIKWSTQITETSYNFYPIYDWRVEDIWHYTYTDCRSYNEIYDRMHRAGMSLHEMRICEPYSMEARNNLDKYHPLEPETWDRIVQRVAGVNLGANHGKSELFAYMRKNKKPPEGLTWKEYSLQILSTMPPPLRAHYWRRIRVFVEWFQNNLGWDDIKEESDPKLESKKKGGSWRMVAHTLLKNDFFCTGLCFSINQDEFVKYLDLVRAYEAGESLDLPPLPEEADQLVGVFSDTPKLSSRRKPKRDKAKEIKERWKDL